MEELQQTYKAAVGGELKFFKDDLVAIGLQCHRAVWCLSQEKTGFMRVAL
jgi:hypothetical protein